MKIKFLVITIATIFLAFGCADQDFPEDWLFTVPGGERAGEGEEENGEDWIVPINDNITIDGISGENEWDFDTESVYDRNVEDGDVGGGVCDLDCILLAKDSSSQYAYFGVSFHNINTNYTIRIKFGEKDELSVEVEQITTEYDFGASKWVCFFIDYLADSEYEFGYLLEIKIDIDSLHSRRLKISVEGEDGGQSDWIPGNGLNNINHEEKKIIRF